MNKLKFMMMWCLLLGAMVSCGGDEEEAAPASVATQDYMPTTKGSVWTYGGSKPYTQRVTGVTKQINDRTYHEMEVTQGTTVNKSYLVKEKDVYWAIGAMPETAGLEVPILKEETPIGKPWEYNGVINGVETKMTFTIEAKDGTKTVEGKQYRDVLTVKVVNSYTYMGVEFEDATTAYYYYAKGVGLILSDFGPLGQLPLLTADIK